jgi:hypothetical protein
MITFTRFASLSKFDEFSNFNAFYLENARLWNKMNGIHPRVEPCDPFFRGKTPNNETTIFSSAEVEREEGLNVTAGMFQS